MPNSGLILGCAYDHDILEFMLECQGVGRVGNQKSESGGSESGRRRARVGKNGVESGRIEGESREI